MLLRALRAPYSQLEIEEEQAGCLGKINRYVPRSHKKGIKSLGPIRATGKEVRDNHYVLHLTPTLQLAVSFLSLEIRA